MKKAQISPLSKTEVLNLVKTVLNKNSNEASQKTIKEGFKRLGIVDPIDDTNRMSFLIQKLSSIETK